MYTLTISKRKEKLYVNVSRFRVCIIILCHNWCRSWKSPSKEFLARQNTQTDGGVRYYWEGRRLKWELVWRAWGWLAGNCSRLQGGCRLCRAECRCGFKLHRVDCPTVPLATPPCTPHRRGNSIKVSSVKKYQTLKSKLNKFYLQLGQGRRKNKWRWVKFIHK